MQTSTMKVSIVSILVLSLSPFASAANLRALASTSDGQVGDAVAYFSEPRDGAPEPEYPGHPLLTEAMEVEYSEEKGHERHLDEEENCGVFADGYHGHLNAGLCVNLSGSWWNDRISWIRASASTCITVSENHNGGQTFEYCGDTWHELVGLSGQVSRVCCDASSGGGGSGGGGGNGDGNDNNNCNSNSKAGEVVALTNSYRARNGRSAVSCHAGMSTVIQNYLEALCDDNVPITHNHDNTTPGGRLTAAGIQWFYTSENLASGTHSDEPSDAMTMWINSSGHNQNLLARDPDHMGAGYVDCDNGWHYWGQVFAEL